MTTWVQPSGGRERGLRGLAQSWVQVLRHPVSFFREAVSPGDQAPGLAFAMAVVFVATTVHVGVAFLDATTALTFPSADVPTLGGGFLVSAFLVVTVYTLLVAPLSLHAIAAIETLLLVALVEERGGVSETVQTIAYATAPCVLAGVPSAPIRFVVAVYGFCLLVVGTREVHGTSTLRAIAVAVVPGALAFGYGFRGFSAAVTLFPWLAEVFPWVRV